MNSMPVADPVTIKRYASSRLYCPSQARYLTLRELGDWVADEEDFVVHDAATGEDITRTVLKQIIIGRGTHG